MSVAENDSGRNAGKSPEAFRTISEVSIELDVPQHVLRFWESKFGQIRPLKRGGGRRYYRPEDLELLRGIRQLLYTDGYTIKGVQKVLRESGSRAVAEIGRSVAGSPATPFDDPAAHVTLPASAAPPAIQGAPATVVPIDERKAKLAAIRAELAEIRALLVADEPEDPS
jgi:DNA-binding transcriptional MerR regulator